MADVLIFKAARLIALISLILVGTSPAFAKPPVLIEMFGKNNCSEDMQMQKDVLELLAQHKNVILVNCRTADPKNNKNSPYANVFCEKRSEAYAKRMNIWSPPTVVVNGQWDAYYKDIGPAIELGESENLQDISVSMSQDGLLDISVPASDGRGENGVLVLYIYAKTTQNDRVLVDADVELTQNILEDILQKKSIPFVTPSRDSEIYVRPIVGMEEIGRWNGTELKLSFPLKELTMISFLERNYNNLSYVVSLHAGDNVGPILATGQLMSLHEMSSILPHSMPVDLQFISQPVPAVVNAITQ